MTLHATELLVMYGAVQSVVVTTEDCGSILDIVITKVDGTLSVFDVIRIPGERLTIGL